MNKSPLKHVIFLGAIKDKHHIVACQIISLEAINNPFACDGLGD